jgi:GT2 family glycosyltransferase
VGNNMAFRRATLAALAFDPLLNYYCDEDDMARRILALGGHIAFAPQAIVQHSHAMTYVGYLRTAYKQGQGSARYWFKYGQYVGRDVLFSVLAWLSLPLWLLDARLAMVTAVCLLLQLLALIMNEIVFKGAPWGWSLAVLPVVLAHNLVKSATVLWTLVRIISGREPQAWRSRALWRTQPLIAPRQP